MKNDAYAEIAASHRLARDGALVCPRPPELEETVLPLGETPEAGAFEPLRKLSTKEELAAELSRMRRWAEPFMANRAPPLLLKRERLTLDRFDWRVETDDDRRDFAGVLAGGGQWQEVSIPHYGEPLGLAATYYRTVFDLAEAQLGGRRPFLCFRGVDYKAQAFLNGCYLGSHEGFFAPFEFDCAAAARTGSNTLVVKVENDFLCRGSAGPASGWQTVTGDKLYAATGLGYDDPARGWHHCPPGMGIWQDVCLEFRNDAHIRDVFVRPLPDKGGAEAWVEVWSSGVLPRRMSLSLSLFGRNFEQTVFTAMPYQPSNEFAAGMGDTLTEACMAGQEPVRPVDMEKGVNYLRAFFAIPAFRRWEPEEPWLYELQASLLDENGTAVDCAARHFGMRTFAFDEAGEPKGMPLLNGRKIRLRGANTMGHEQQCVFKKDFDQLRDDILLAKLCNMNFLRITQRPVQEEVYDYCDMLGLMVQTDLPLFGVLRRNQFAEALRQAGEMERLIRPHPSCVLVSYVNEPFPNGGNKPHRNLTRDELASFFECADRVVRLMNPDRAVKAVDGDYDPPGPGLPDNHCYCAWYNGHGVDIGKLHRGYWQPVKKGWLYGCGEFGAEGLDPVETMRRHYPAQWLPQCTEEEALWSPERIVKSQTAPFHYFFYDTPCTLAGWVAASHRHQAWAARFMTEAFRRDAGMVSTVIHLFIDAFPAGWMKAIMDAERNPKPAYFAYRDALTPLMAQWRTDRFAFFSGEEIALEAWVCNDRDEAPGGLELRYALEAGGRLLSSGKSPAVVPACGSRYQGHARFAAPAVRSRQAATARIALVTGDGAVLHDNVVELTVFPVAKAEGGPAVALGEKAARLAEELGLSAVPLRKAPTGAPLIVSNMAWFMAHERELLARVAEGAALALLELPAGPHIVAGSVLNVKPCGMSPLHFVSRATGHPLVEDFEPEDFRLWHSPADDCIAPLLESTFTGGGLRPILSSCNTDGMGNWGPALAAAELPHGKGSIRVCQVKLAGRTGTNPAAALFARRLLGLPEGE